MWRAISTSHVVVDWNFFVQIEILLYTQGSLDTITREANDPAKQTSRFLDMNSCKLPPPAKRRKLLGSLESPMLNESPSNYSWTRGQTPWFECFQFIRRDKPSDFAPADTPVTSDECALPSSVESSTNDGSSVDNAPPSFPKPLVGSDCAMSERLVDGNVQFLLHGRIYKGCGPFFLEAKLGLGLVQYQLGGVSCQRKANPSLGMPSEHCFRTSRARPVGWNEAVPLIVALIRGTNGISAPCKSRNKSTAHLLLYLKKEVREAGNGKLGEDASVWSEWLWEIADRISKTMRPWLQRALNHFTFIPFLGLLTYPRLLQHVECERLASLSWKDRMRLEDAFDAGPAALLLPPALKRRVLHCSQVSASQKSHEQRVLDRAVFLNGLPSSRIREGVGACLEAFASIVHLCEDDSHHESFITEKGLRKKHGPSISASPVGGGQSELHRRLSAILPVEAFWAVLGLSRLVVVNSGSTVHRIGIDSLGLPHLFLEPGATGTAKEQKLLQGMFPRTSVDFNNAHYPGLTALMTYAGWLIPLPALGGDKAHLGHKIGSAAEHFQTCGVFGVCEKPGNAAAMVCFVENFNNARAVHDFLMEPASCMPFWDTTRTETLRRGTDFDEEANDAGSAASECVQLNGTTHDVSTHQSWGLGSSRTTLVKSEDVLETVIANTHDDESMLQVAQSSSTHPADGAAAEPQLHERQHQAIQTLHACPVLLLTGPAGTGKTFTISHFNRGMEKQARSMDNVLFCAPTHELVNKLNAEQVRAVTLQHFVVLGERNVAAFNTRYSDVSILVIDEVSMIDVDEFARLLRVLKRMPSLRRLALLGDWRQLPSVRSGNLLQDLIFFCHWNKNSLFTMVELSHNYRVQSEEGNDGGAVHSVQSLPDKKLPGEHGGLHDERVGAVKVEELVDTTTGAGSFHATSSRTAVSDVGRTPSPVYGATAANSSLCLSAQYVGQSLFADHSQLCQLPSTVPIEIKLRVRQAQEAFARSCVFSRPAVHVSPGVSWHILPDVIQGPVNTEPTGSLLGRAVLYAAARNHARPSIACQTQMLCSTNQTRHSINRAIAGLLFPGSFGEFDNNSIIAAPLLEPSRSSPELLFIGMKLKFVGTPCITTQAPHTGAAWPRGGNKARFMVLAAAQQNIPDSKDGNTPLPDLICINPQEAMRWDYVASGRVRYQLTCVLLGQPGTHSAVQALSLNQQFTKFLPSSPCNNAEPTRWQDLVDKSPVFFIDLDAAKWSGIELAYAVTTHAMQGLEEKTIWFVLEDSMCVNNPVLYTALTRARTSFIGLVAPRRFARKSDNCSQSNAPLRCDELVAYDSLARISTVIQRSPPQRHTALRWLLTFSDSCSQSLDTTSSD
jgi:hypothetical protein